VGKITIQDVLVKLIVTNRPHKRVVHVGASTGQEVIHYLNAGFDDITLIEPIPEIVDTLNAQFGDNDRIKIIQALVLDSIRDVDFHLANNQGMSSSIYEEINNDMHNIHYIGKMTLKSTTLDLLLEWDHRDIDLLVVDTQGAEAEVFAGGQRALERTKAILTEASLTPLYEGACVFDDLLSVIPKTFELEGLYLNDRGTGDALFLCRA